MKQARRSRPTRRMSGFLAAFTSPMLITGSRQDLLRSTRRRRSSTAQVILKISTDGKFLVIGKLNFAANNLSISGRLYADLSKVADGDATVLFLADIPDQVRLLTIYGKLKMGFRTPTGEEVAFKVLDDPGADPTTQLAGPMPGGQTGGIGINLRGYVDVTFPDVTGGTLQKDSILDLAPEFEIKTGNSASTVQLDTTQAPIYLQGDTFRFWTKGVLAQDDAMQIVFLRETWSYLLSTGETQFNQNGAYTDPSGTEVNNTPDSQSLTLVVGPYIERQAGAEPERDPDGRRSADDRRRCHRVPYPPRRRYVRHRDRHRCQGTDRAWQRYNPLFPGERSPVRHL